MIDAGTQTLLQEVMRRELRSLLQYLAEAFPWTTEDKEPILAALHRQSAESREVVARITRFLRKNRAALPYLGAYAMDFTNINFIGLDYALARLVKDERRMVADLESYLGKLGDGEARMLVEELLAVKQSHLKELEASTGQVPATTLR